MSDTGYKLMRAANGMEIKLLPKMVIGRLDECDLQLGAGGASRRHAVLTIEDEQLWLDDFKSANGTFVNEQRIESKTLLNAGDRIRIDVEEFVVVAPAMVAAATIMKKVEPEVVRNNSPAVQSSSGISSAGAPGASPVTGPGTNPNVPGAWASSDGSAQEAEGRTAFMARKDLQEGLESAGVSTNLLQQIKVAVPTLLIYSGQHAQQHLELNTTGQSKAEWTVGSDPGRNIVLTDSGVSSLHAVISVEGARWKLVDKMSANGTFVNGRGAPSVYLSPGDQISFGPVKCVFLTPQTKRDASTTPIRKEEQPKKNNRGLIIGLVSFGVTLLLIGVLYLLRGR